MSEFGIEFVGAVLCAQSLSRVRLFATPRAPGCSVHGNSPGKNTGMGCHGFLQGIFPTKRSNPSLPHGRGILYHLKDGLGKNKVTNFTYQN